MRERMRIECVRGYRMHVYTEECEAQDRAGARLYAPIHLASSYHYILLYTGVSSSIQVSKQQEQLRDADVYYRRCMILYVCCPHNTIYTGMYSAIQVSKYQEQLREAREQYVQQKELDNTQVYACVVSCYVLYDRCLGIRGMRSVLMPL
jgi:hypothetical protein